MDAAGRHFRGAVAIRPRPDDTAPVVLAPPPLTLATSSCFSGIAVLDSRLSPRLAAFLMAAVAKDDCVVPTRLPPRLGAGSFEDMVFTVGRYRLVFPFEDAAGNVGSASSTLEVLLRGDVTGDGVRSILDVTTLAASLVGNVVPGTPPFVAPLETGDADGDGVLGVFDLVLLAAAIVGNVPCLPAGVAP